MRWHEITIYTTEEATESLAYYLNEYGAGGVSIEESGSLNRERDTSLGQWYEKPLNNLPEGDAIIKAYFSETDHTNLDDILSQLNRLLKDLPGFGIRVGKAELTTAIVDEEDWANAWKQFFKPVRISQQLTIKPTWESYVPGSGEKVIELDPGMAFGTGTHATTSLCLRLLEQVIQQDDDVIDVGTGSGILAIGAVHLGAKHVLALDLDPVAVSSASENVRLNGFEQQVTVKQSDLLQAISQEYGRKQYDVLAANILAPILISFMEEAAQAVKPGAWYVASGIISSQEHDVIEAMEQSGFQVIHRLLEEDWVALAARRKGD